MAFQKTGLTRTPETRSDPLPKWEGKSTRRLGIAPREGREGRWETQEPLATPSV